MIQARDVDEYIANAPKEVQEKQKELRVAIKSVAPEVEEKISYGMPTAIKEDWYISLTPKTILAFYPVPPITEMYSKELARFKTGKATIQFPLSEKLPIALIKKLVKARVKINEDSAKK